MKGSPLVRAVVVFLVILSLGWPLYHLSKLEEQKVATAEAETKQQVSAEAQLLELELSFTREAKAFEIRHLGNVVWRKEAPGLQESTRLPIVFPKEGVELQIRAELEGSGLSAIRCRLTTPQGDEYERSVWGDGNINAVIPFP
ncbi:MAG: hypothetical protein WCO60_04035 [Verrucomicrobiota bacterium]